MHFNLVSGLFVGAVFAATLSAQQPANNVKAAPAMSAATAKAIRAVQTPIIDGKDDDAVWKIAPTYSDFVEFQPTEGKAPRFKTEFKAAYDDRNLYV